MSQSNITKSYTLGAMFLVGQLAAVCGAIVGLLGTLLLGNLLLVIFCLVLCSSGIALARFALKYYRAQHGTSYGEAGLILPDKVDKAIKIIGYLSIGGAVAFGWFMFGDSHTAYAASWPLYGFLFCVSIYILTFISASSFTAWKVFFKGPIKNK
jgi:hypothetical protein